MSQLDLLRDRIAQADLFRSLKHEELRSKPKLLAEVWSPSSSAVTETQISN